MFFSCVSDQQTTLYCTHTVFDDLFDLLSHTPHTLDCPTLFHLLVSDNILISCWDFTSLLRAEAAPYGCVVAFHAAREFWIHSFCFPSLMLRPVHACITFDDDTLISISLIVFHALVFMCFSTHCADFMVTHGRLYCSVWGWNCLESLTDSFAPLVRGGAYLDSLMFSLISTSQIPHYALLSVSCKQYLHLMWGKCNPCWSWRTTGCVVKTLTPLIVSLLGEFVL